MVKISASKTDDQCISISFDVGGRVYLLTFPKKLTVASILGRSIHVRSSCGDDQIWFEGPRAGNAIYKTVETAREIWTYLENEKEKGLTTTHPTL